jgi:hypothetical protein
VPQRLIGLVLLDAIITLMTPSFVAGEWLKKEFYAVTRHKTKGFVLSCRDERDAATFGKCAMPILETKTE